METQQAILLDKLRIQATTGSERLLWKSVQRQLQPRTLSPHGRSIELKEVENFQRPCTWNFSAIEYLFSMRILNVAYEEVFNLFLP